MMYRRSSARQPRTFAQHIAAAGGIAAMAANSVLDVIMRMGMFERAERENRQRTRVFKRNSKHSSWPYCGDRHRARIGRQIDAGRLRADNGLVV